ncbi:MAG: hypothetical protein JXA30_05615 [Deltaproteobacteria bacterium]|nr:hypothetical protein [Deltaproteobacteria bacterium]
MAHIHTRKRFGVAAQSQGRHAAKVMAGSTDAYREIPFFWTRQYDVSIKYIGYGGRAEQVVFRDDPEGGPFVADWRITSASPHIEHLSR